jgi:tRNA A58 N-methylase Trm61
LGPGDRVLEPSAGTGALLAALERYDCGEIVAVEINRDLCCGLWNVYAHVQTFCLDFLTTGIPGGHLLGPKGLFDRIVMNPPFADQQDIRHVNHALGFLKPGGRLVAIMAAGITFREDRLAREFRAVLEERGRSIEELPEDAFKASGTGVRAVLVTIEG